MSEDKKSCCGGSSQVETCSDSPNTPVGGSTGCCSAKPKAPVSSCCGSDTPVSSDDASCCAPADKQRRDWIMWTCLPAVVLSDLGFLVIGHTDQYPDWLGSMLHTSYEMVNAMWWGILSAAFFVGILGRIPREAIMSVLGRGGSKRGIFRATLAGLLLDLCNHGILMVAMKLYERGASIGQVMAFLIASPWNSLTLTLILVGLIGLQWTLLFIAASLLIAWISGWIFDRLCDRGVLPANPNTVEFEDIAFWPSVKASWKEHDWRPKALLQMFWGGLKESRMVLRWVVFGVVLVALIRAFVPPESFGVWFGASMSGLLLTLLATTLIEVCSEGSSPIAADLFNRAGAPGNAFTFLMAGAATDYTEIMALKDTTRSWKIALFLPLITVPQVLAIGWIMNVAGT
ncbi:MAG TPA: ATPase [Oceanospirillales bacterium]|nr:ATPase [Oceanospirillales bacterium]